MSQILYIFQNESSFTFHNNWRRGCNYIITFKTLSYQYFIWMLTLWRLHLSWNEIWFQRSLKVTFLLCIGCVFFLSFIIIPTDLITTLTFVLIYSLILVLLFFPIKYFFYIEDWDQKIIFLISTKFFLVFLYLKS